MSDKASGSDWCHSLVLLTFDLIVPIVVPVISCAVALLLCSNHCTPTKVQNIVRLIVCVKNTLQTFHCLFLCRVQYTAVCRLVFSQLRRLYVFAESCTLCTVCLLLCLHVKCVCDLCVHVSCVSVPRIPRVVHECVFAIWCVVFTYVEKSCWQFNVCM